MHQTGSRVVLQLSAVLISSSKLPQSHQDAMSIAIQRLLQQRVSAALTLTLAVGSCCSLGHSLLQQLTCLVRDEALIDVMLETLDSTTAASDHKEAAVIVRAIRHIVRLHSSTNLVNVSHVLAKAWAKACHRIHLLRTACLSPAAAEAVAALTVAAAMHCVPAAAILSDLQSPIGASSCSDPTRISAIIQRRAWVAVALGPLLHQIRLQLSTCRGSVVPQAAVLPAGELLQDGGLQLTVSPGFRELWLLLCAAVCAADGQLLDIAVQDALGQLLFDTAGVQHLQTALLATAERPTLTGPGSAAAHHSTAAVSASAAGGGGGSVALAAVTPTHQAVGTGVLSTSASSSRDCGGNSSSTQLPAACSSCCRDGAELPVLLSPTLQLLSQAAGHSVALAQQACLSLAPLVPTLLLHASSTHRRPGQCADGTAVPCSTAGQAPGGLLPPPAAQPAAAAAAGTAQAGVQVLQLWQQIILKGRGGFPAVLRALLVQWLPGAAGTIAAAAPLAAPAAAGESAQHAQQQQQQQLALERANAVADALVPLADATVGGRTLLLGLAQQHPSVLLAALADHVPALMQLMQLAAADDRPTVPDNVVLVATWLLQGCAAAVQQQPVQRPQRGQQHQLWACSSSSLGDGDAGALHVAGMLHAAAPQLLLCCAALVSAGCREPQALRCQTAAVDFALTLLNSSTAPCSISISCSSSSSSSSCGSGQDMCIGTRAAGGGCDSCVASASDAAGPGGSGGTVANPGLAVAQQQLLAALQALFASTSRDPVVVMHRRLLHTACCLLHVLARHSSVPTSKKQQQQQGRQAVPIQPQPKEQPSNTEHCAGDVAVSSTDTLMTHGILTQQQQQQQQQWVWHELHTSLKVLHADLAARSLARSSSREELLHAVSDALELAAAMMGSQDRARV